MALDNYAVYISDDHGKRVAPLSDVLTINYTNIANDVGAFSLTFPASRPLMFYRPDFIAEIWRRPISGGSFKLDFAGLIRGREQAMDENGNETVTVWGTCPNELLSRRIVAYYAGTAYTDKTDYADDMMLEIVRENFGTSSTDTDRSWAGLGFKIASNISAAPSISKGFSWRRVINVLQDICDAATTNGTRLFFIVKPYEYEAGRLSFMFTTATEQLGTERNLIASPHNGTLSSPYYSEDFGDERTYIYAGGSNQGTDRTIATATDAFRLTRSAWNRREAFADARGEETAAVTATAQAELAASVPVARIGGVITDTPFSRYGVDWNYGDSMIIDYAGIQADAIVNGINVTANASGETVLARLEALTYE
jgi:hypothetical protein